MGEQVACVSLADDTESGEEFFVPRWAMNSWEMSIQRSSCCRKPKANRFSMEDVSSSMSLRPLHGEAERGQLRHRP